MSIVIGSVPYLNGRPLMRWFTETDVGRQTGVSVIEAVPSALAKLLESREISAALVSSVELFRKPGLTFVPGCAVIADGPVESVRVLSKVPVSEIKRVAMDTSSLTSVALTKIIFAERFGLRPDYIDHAPDFEQMITIADAALLIGDLGYRDYGPEYVSVDLGEEWKKLTGLPFVYACWIGYPDLLTDELSALLREAKEWGIRNLLSIAASEYAPLGETPRRTRHYLTEVMRYTMSDREEEALKQFGARVKAHHLV